MIISVLVSVHQSRSRYIPNIICFLASWFEVSCQSGFKCPDDDIAATAALLTVVEDDQRLAAGDQEEEEECCHHRHSVSR